MHKLWCYFCVFANICILFGGILQNPGIPQQLIDRILKEQMGKGEDEDQEMEDLESGKTTTSQRSKSS